MKNKNIFNSKKLSILLLATGLTFGGNTGTDITNVYDHLHKFHGHTCAGSLMGARLGIAAKAALKRLGAKGTFMAEYFSRSCPVDGIQVTVGTTFGNRTFKLHDKDEHRLILTDKKSGRKVEARLTDKAMEKAKPTRDMRKKARKLPKGSPERIQLEKEIENVFEWFRTAAEADVVIVKTL